RSGARGWSYHSPMGQPFPDDSALPGIVGPRIERWLAPAVGATQPVALSLIAAGASNLTFEVTDASGGHWALRRPPVGQGLATAHDVGREWQVLTALHEHDTGVPVPAPVARCDDEAGTGAPFYVRAFAAGTILRTADDAPPRPPPPRPGPPARRGRLAARHPGSAPRRRPRGGGPRRARRQRRLRRAPARALGGPVQPPPGPAAAPGP